MMWVKHGMTPNFAKTVKIDPRFSWIYPNILKLSKNIHIHLVIAVFRWKYCRYGNWEYIFLLEFLYVLSVLNALSVLLNLVQFIYFFTNKKEYITLSNILWDFNENAISYFWEVILSFWNYNYEILLFQRRSVNTSVVGQIFSVGLPVTRIQKLVLV